MDCVEKGRGFLPECLADSLQNPLFVRELEKAFADHLFIANPDRQLSHSSTGIEPGHNAGRLLQKSRHPGGIQAVVQSNQAVADYNFLHGWVPVLCGSGYAGFVLL